MRKKGSRRFWGRGRLVGRGSEADTISVVAQMTNQYVESEAQVDTTTLELLAEWRRMDSTDNPDEIQAATKDLEEFKRAMNENRLLAGDAVLYP
jgi:hypothetical protein